MDSRPPRLIPAIAALLAFSLAACLPPTEEEKEKAEVAKEKALRAAATPTPTPTPKPGAWMHEKRENPLGIQGNPLDEKPKK